MTNLTIDDIKDVQELMRRKPSDYMSINSLENEEIKKMLRKLSSGDSIKTFYKLLDAARSVGEGDFA